MKKFSIRNRIIFLYTFLFALLIAINFSILDASANKILIDQAERGVIAATEEIADSIQMEDDGVYIEGDDDEETFHFYHDGVLFLVYSNNQVAYGYVPSDFDSTLSIQIETIQIQEYNGMTWVAYDVSIESGYVLRGIYDINVMADSLNQILIFAGISSVLIIILSALGGYWIIIRAFKPIQKIYKTAAAISEEEDYTKRIQTDFAKDEVHELAGMVNRMLDTVEQSISREKQFSSNVSHELRTPLTVMQAQAEYLLEKTANNDLKDEIKTIISQVAFMENIVTQLLEITRSKQISANEMEEIDLRELTLLTADSFSSQLEEKQIALTIKEPNFSVKTLGNQTMLIRVFSNLIVNAIKYNKPKGSIQISFAKDDNQIIVNVSDTGIGIAKDKLDKIFNPFYRADESRSQKDFSLGLGLALVREVVKIHGGDIKVNSIENEGTTFTINLPIMK